MIGWLLACTAVVLPTDSALQTEAALEIVQLDLPGPAPGEAALLIGDDGTTVLIDVGNDSHAADVQDALERRGLTGVDWVVLTHLHADHIGGVDELFGPDGPVTVRQGIVWRGAVALDDANDSELDELLEVLTTVPEVALCDEGGCALPWTVPVGSAELTVFLAAGELATDGGVEDLPVERDEENALSLGGVLSMGDFDYLFAGDLTGGGKDTPDVESAIVDAAPPAVPAGTVDVLHVSHHGISSSTNATWVDWALGSGDATAVVGANSGYLDAPSEEALEALLPALGEGHVWVTHPGLLGAGERIDAEGEVIIEVTGDGEIRVSAPAIGASQILTAM